MGLPLKGKTCWSERICNTNETMYGSWKPASQAEKIIGQVQAIGRMLNEDVPCEDVLSQINAAKSALHGCGKVVLEGHIKHCVRNGIEHGMLIKLLKALRKRQSAFPIWVKESSKQILTRIAEIAIRVLFFLFLHKFNRGGFSILYRDSNMKVTVGLFGK